MTIIRTLTIGQKIWLGWTQYEVIDVALDERKKVIPDTFELKPVGWHENILGAPDGIRAGVQKTQTIRTKLPIRLLDSKE